MNENNVTHINKYRTEELSSMERYKHSKFRKFIGGAALIATLAASPYLVQEGKKMLENFPATQTNVYENVDETFEYTIRPGDTIGDISERTAVVMEGVQHQQNLEANIADFNSIEASGDIKAGETLNLPVDISGVTLENNG